MKSFKCLSVFVIIVLCLVMYNTIQSTTPESLSCRDLGIGCSRTNSRCAAMGSCACYIQCWDGTEKDCTVIIIGGE